MSNMSEEEEKQGFDRMKMRGWVRRRGKSIIDEDSKSDSVKVTTDPQLDLSYRFHYASTNGARN